MLSWQTVRGHESLVRAFQDVVQRGRLAHAYLFVGPVGVGKRLFAMELAKALLCENRANDALEACDHCPACLQVMAQTHPDFFTASRPEDQNEFTIEAIRDLTRELGLKPARGRGKIAVVDDADDFNDEAANCFLKTLEEPPPRSLLILIGTNPELQLPTIQSRCQVVRFSPLPERLIAELLRTQEGADRASIPRLAQLSEGSMGRAVALADPALWDFRDSLIQGLTAANIDRVVLAEAWTRFLQDAGKDAPSQRQRAALVLGLLIDFLKNALATSIGVTHERPAEEEKQLRQVSERLGPERLLQLLERCLEADAQIYRFAQIGLIVEALVDAAGGMMMAGR